MDLLEKAYELGRHIATTEEYIKMRDAEEQVRRDREARRIVKDFQDLQSSYTRMQMQGHSLTPENLQTLRDAEAKAMANPVVKNYYECTLRFHELWESINDKIRQGVTGEVPQSEPRAPSCSGG
ncbi:YlbF family regulator [Desulfurispora thermophila]|uniref:YlbF family regulator n=1 Tax=Desulfurispora thermophila TaxID=265470 RepID=UPI00036DD07C|nr:YlbF family regulator [Desulfurispora thermophila]